MGPRHVHIKSGYLQLKDWRHGLSFQTPTQNTHMERKNWKALKYKFDENHISILMMG